MEFTNPYWALFGVLGYILWIINNKGLFRAHQISFFQSETKSQYKNRLLSFVWNLTSILAWGLIAIALARPRYPKGLSDQTIFAKDIFVVVDVSRSMAAEDFKPNRLEVARREIKRFIASRPDDRIGIIMFSEKVFTLLPLTTDLELVLNMSDSIQMNILGMGTNIGDALGLAVARLKESEAKSKIIILLTDGVSNVGNMTPEQASEEAKNGTIKIYSIGIGAVENGKVLRQGFGYGNYQNIPGGSVDFKSLNEISVKTGGKSYLASDPNSLSKVIDEIQSLEKTEIKKSGFIIYDEKYLIYYIYGASLLAMLTIIDIFGRKRIV